MIICNGVFDACYQEDALSEMLRVIKVGGYLMFSGKNNMYFLDDEEAFIAEVNARKKGHPNYFTDVHNMLDQLKPFVEVVRERYALRRGDYAKGLFESVIPDTFYEWALIVKKTVTKDTRIEFNKFSDLYSLTYATHDKS